MDKYFKLELSCYEDNIYHLVPLPVIQQTSIYELIGYINRGGYLLGSGKIRIDLVTMTGDRYGRFIEGYFKNGKVLFDTFNVIDKDDNLENFTICEFSNLPTEVIDRIYPISLRNILKNKSEKL